MIRRVRAPSSWRLLAILASAGCQKKAGETPRAQARDASRVVTVEPRADRRRPRRLRRPGPARGGRRLAADHRLSRRQGAGRRGRPWVKAGQPLAQLDDTLLRAQLAQQRRWPPSRRVAADQAEAEAARVKGLDNQGVLSQEQIDTRRFAARAAQRPGRRPGRRRCSDMRTREGLMTVRAPFAGLVLERNVRPGDLRRRRDDALVPHGPGRPGRAGRRGRRGRARQAPARRRRPRSPWPTAPRSPGVVRLVSPQSTPRPSSATCASACRCGPTSAPAASPGRSSPALTALASWPCRRPPCATTPTAPR